MFINKNRPELLKDASRRKSPNKAFQVELSIDTLTYDKSYLKKKKSISANSFAVSKIFGYFYEKTQLSGGKGESYSISWICWILSLHFRHLLRWVREIQFIELFGFKCAQTKFFFFWTHGIF